MAPTLLQALRTWNDAEAHRQRLDRTLATAVARNDQRAANDVMLELRDAEIFAEEMRITMLHLLSEGTVAGAWRI